jgi:general stress protein 26
MAPDTTTDRSLDEVLDGHRFAMVTTSSPKGLTARPLTLLEHDGAVLRFLVSTDAEWVQQLGNPIASVQVSFASPSDNSWVALQGHAALEEDRATIERLWNPAASAYLDGPDDPRAAVLEATIYDGEWWDGPSGKIGMAVSIGRRLLTGEGGGEHGAVEPTP